jgi:hypothetical protein
MPGSLATRVTYLLEPKNWLIVTVVGVGAHADGLAGAGWGLLAAFFAAVLPTVFISYGIRRGRWENRNVGDRRPLVLGGYLLVGLLGWSRVAVRDQTVLQVVGGSVLGAAAAALAYAALR